MNDPHDNAFADREAGEKALRTLAGLAKRKLEKALTILTKRAEEPWSPKIAAAVPAIREALALLDEPPTPETR